MTSAASVKEIFKLKRRLVEQGADDSDIDRVDQAFKAGFYQLNQDEKDDVRVWMVAIETDSSPEQEEKQEVLNSIKLNQDKLKLSKELHDKLAGYICDSLARCEDPEGFLSATLFDGFTGYKNEPDANLLSKFVWLGLPDQDADVQDMDDDNANVVIAEHTHIMKELQCLVAELHLLGNAK